MPYGDGVDGQGHPVSHRGPDCHPSWRCNNDVMGEGVGGGYMNYMAICSLSTNKEIFRFLTCISQIKILLKICVE